MTTREASPIAARPANAEQGTGRLPLKKATVWVAAAGGRSRGAAGWSTMITSGRRVAMMASGQMTAATVENAEWTALTRALQALPADCELIIECGSQRLQDAVRAILADPSAERRSARSPIRREAELELDKRGDAPTRAHGPGGPDANSEWARATAQRAHGERTKARV